MGGVTLDEVDGQIARGFRALRFRPRIEALFRRDYAAERARLVVTWGVVGAVIYNLIYFADRIMVSDMLAEVVALRMLVFTPLVVVAVMIARGWPNALLYDVLTVVISFLAVTLPMFAAMSSDSAYLFVYQSFNAAAFLFFVISLRPRFPAVLFGLLVMCLSHFTTTRLAGSFDTVSYSGIVIFYLTLSVFLAASAYFLEWTDRQNFLNQLRGGLLYRQLESISERDELTGLLNRRSLARFGETIWSDTANQPMVSAILLDIDHFKRFNDVHGHIEGDACIRAVSNCIRDNVQETSRVFRFGGEEILILSCGQDPLQVVATAERIRNAIEQMGIPNGGLGNACVTASLGVASAIPSDIRLEELLRKADDALYEAKRRGRNIVAIAEEELEPAMSLA